MGGSGHELPMEDGEEPSHSEYHKKGQVTSGAPMSSDSEIGENRSGSC
jgi:hypothetical protein